MSKKLHVNFKEDVWKMIEDVKLIESHKTYSKTINNLVRLGSDALFEKFTGIKPTYNDICSQNTKLLKEIKSSVDYIIINLKKNHDER